MSVILNTAITMTDPRICTPVVMGKESNQPRNNNEKPAALVQRQRTYQLMIGTFQRRVYSILEISVVFRSQSSFCCKSYHLDADYYDMVSQCQNQLLQMICPLLLSPTNATLISRGFSSSFDMILTVNNLRELYSAVIIYGIGWRMVTDL